MSDKKSVLQEAEELVNGARQEQYGHPYVDFSRTAKLLTGLLYAKLKEGAVIEPQDVALIQICVKLSRLANSPEHRDSQVDIAGYIATYEKVMDKKKEIEEISRGIWPDGGNIPDIADKMARERSRQTKAMMTSDDPSEPDRGALGELTK